MTPSQLAALRAALLAETDQVVVDAIALRNDPVITNWLNVATAVDAWNPAMSDQDLFEATDITKFDNISAGKRDGWDLMIENAPIDCARNKNRKAIEDTWGAADSVAVLQACRRKATRAEIYLTPNVVGNQATTNTVMGLKLSWAGSVSVSEVSDALNLGA